MTVDTPQGRELPAGGRWVARAAAGTPGADLQTGRGPRAGRGRGAIPGATLFHFCSRPSTLPLMAERRTTLPFYSLTLGHLVQPQAALVVSCGACRRTAQVDVLPLLVRLGPTFGVRELERRLTCEACGRKGFSLVQVEWLCDRRG